MSGNQPEAEKLIQAHRRNPFQQFTTYLPRAQAIASSTKGNAV